MEEKNVVLDVIIEMVKGLKTNDGAMETYVNGKVYKLWSCKYLLNQILRQWHLTDDKRYVSKKAYELFLVVFQSCHVHLHGCQLYIRCGPFL